MNYKNLFLQASYKDCFELYKESLLGLKDGPVLWDYVILTASNESQAAAYKEQIEYRKNMGTLPKSVHYAVIPDYKGLRVGSGGATLGVIDYIMQKEGSLDNLRILVIHSGGDSKRVPQYSACGKLFSPVPHQFPNGRGSTLFDEFIIAVSGVPNRMAPGMLVLSGDVLLLFNPMQMAFFDTDDAAAISIKEDVNTGKEHGVFLNDGNNMVGSFLHKQTVETLKNAGAVDKLNKVNIDTGAIMLSTRILKDLYSLVDTKEKFASLVNDTVRLSFYADFVYPLATNSSLEQFLKEQPEGEFNNELINARKEIFKILSGYNMKLICMAPASFLHFGTSQELLNLVIKDIEKYSFLDWSSSVASNKEIKNVATYNSIISGNAKISEGTYIENCEISDGAKIGSNSIISGATIENMQVPDNVILHVLKLNDGKFVARMIGIDDNPKENKLFGKEIDMPLWDKPLFTACDTAKEAIKATLSGKTGEYSLCSSFNNADSSKIIKFGDMLYDKVVATKFSDKIDANVPASEINDLDITERVKNILLKVAENADFSKKIRIYFYLAKVLDSKEIYDLCFKTIGTNVLNATIKDLHYDGTNKLVKESEEVSLPVRVNWGGGWSDTPPYCNENGGKVLNAAVTLNGKLPIKVTVKKIPENKFILASTDFGAYKEFIDITELQDSSNPHDFFALHKSALIACSIIPKDEKISVEEICKSLGGGIYFNTMVDNIPGGSGLGTSSILAGACVKALLNITGKNYTDNELYGTVLCMEQLMSTGGGWQDQVGGLAKGIKMVTAKSGMYQDIKCQNIEIPQTAKAELDQRFVLIYTGQRRLARNLLRNVVGRYIGHEDDSVQALSKIQLIAEQMKQALIKGDIDGFAHLLNTHWEQSKIIDNGSTNTCIDQIFLSVDDLIEGKMMCGAGGGGFLQVVLKKGVTKKQLEERLFDVFSDSGVKVYNCNILY